MLTVRINDSVKPQIYSIIQSELEDYHDNNVRSGINFIVPESVKASVEREVIKHQIDTCSEVEVAEQSGKQIASVNSSLIDGDVLSFIRLGVRILEMSGKSYYGASSDLILRNVIYRILVEHKEEFTVFSRLASRLEYVDMLIVLLQDLVRYNIRHSQLIKAYEIASADSTSIASYVDKLHDLSILTGYIEEYNDKYGFKLLVSIISQADKVLMQLVTNPDLRDKFEYYELMNFLKGRFVLIGFGVDRLLTPEELSFVSHLSTLGADIRLYPLADGTTVPEDGHKIYYYGNKTLDSIVNSMDYSVDDMTDGIADAIPDTDTLSGITENYIFEKKEAEAKPRQNLICTEIKGVDDRIAYIANEIIDLTRNKGYRYKDIRIVCVDDELIPRMKSILSTFGLDGFIDHRIALNNTPVLRYVQELVHLPLRNYDLVDVLALMRTSFLMIAPELIDLFENYAIKYNLTWKDRIFNEACYQRENEKYPCKIRIGEKFYHINNLGEFIWDKIVLKYLMPVYALCQSLINASSIAGKASILAEEIDSKRYLVERLRDELLDRKDTDGASALVLGYKEIMNLLTSFVDEVNDVPMTIENFDTLLRIDMSSKSAGSIPLKVDSIEITNPRMCYLTPCKVMFVVGADESNFPYSKSSESILNNKELKQLFEAADVEYHEKAENKNKQEYIVSSLMLNSVSDYLYFVHEYGKPESSVYTYLKNFVSDECVNYNCFTSPIYGTPVDKRHEFDKAIISTDTMKKFLADENTISVSALESYNTCHMKYMLENILTINARDDGTVIQPNIIGSLAHDMLENMFMRVKDVCGDDKAKLNNMIFEYDFDSDILSDLIDESYDIAVEKCKHPDKMNDVFTSSQGDKVKRIVRKAFVDLLSECYESDYKPEYFEYRLKDAQNSIEIVTDNGVKFNFRGVIDRVDVKYGNPKDARIVDYKTGPKSINLGKLIQGTQIQLFTYANSLVRNGYNVVDVGYAPIGLSSRKGETLELSVQGLKISDNPRDMKTEDIGLAIRYTDKLLIDGCHDIIHGDASAKTEYKNNYSCGYCIYRGICGNSISNPVTRESKLELPHKAQLYAQDYLGAIRECLEDGE